MPHPVETLLLGAAALILASLALTGFGMRQRRYPGFDLWVGALWLTTLGALIGAAWNDSMGHRVAEALMMQWPVLALVGLRRFLPRQLMPGHERTDWLVLAMACGLVLTSASLPAGMDWLHDAVIAGVHLYAATLLFMAPGGRESTPVQGLGAVMALAAIIAVLCTLPGAELLSPGVARMASAMLGAVTLAFAAVTLVSERTEHLLRDSRRRLRVLANLDPLTQVPNRRRFQELAGDALSNDTPGSAVLVMFDVDHFKQINDSLGHAAGDRALCLVCGSVLEHLRTQDVPGRHGGDEFVLLLRETNTGDATGVAARIVADVQRRAPGHQLPALSLSFGLVQVGMVEDIRQALRRADQALYEAKRQGRSRAVIAQGDEQRPVFSESQRLGLTAA